MKTSHFQRKLSAKKIFKRTQVMYTFPRQEKSYLYMIVGLTVICAFVYPYPGVAMWVAFMLAGYSAIANDSIQTIGTFISSNVRRVRWYYLWLFMGLIFVGTVLYSWWVYDGDISYQRLQNKGLDEAPTEFTFLHLFAPLVLLLLTRMRMPVSTSVLLLSVFTTKASTLGKIVAKSFLGYLIAFLLGLLIWYAIMWLVRRYRLPRRAASWWYVLQWITSGMLWSMWIMQDMANFAVVLPRALSLYELVIVVGYIVLGLGVLFYLRGDKIQRVIEEKTSVVDVRVATVIDISYALILYFLKEMSKIPISTTWVFIGLLGGREAGLSLSIHKKRLRRRRISYAIRLIARDVLYAGIGLLVSVLMALGVNEEMQNELLQLLGFR